MLSSCLFYSLSIQVIPYFHILHSLTCNQVGTFVYHRLVTFMFCYLRFSKPAQFDSDIFAHEKDCDLFAVDVTNQIIQKTLISFLQHVNRRVGM